MKVTTLACLGLLAAGIGSARADLRMTSQMIMSGTETGQANAAAGLLMRTTTFYKNMDEREERTTDMMGLFQSTDVTLTLCKEQQTVTMDPALKIYTIEPITGAPAVPPSPDAKKAPKPVKSGAGRMITTYSVQDLGTEKLQNLDTRHSIVTTRIQTSGCLGESDNTIKYEVWTAPKDIKHCPAQYTPSRTVAGPDGCSITYEVKGDATAMQRAMGGMIVQQKFYFGDKVSMTQELREWSEATLDASLFTVPSDYKKVTRPEFDKAKAAAMQRGMMRGVTAGAPQPPTEGKDEKSSGGKTVADEAAETVNDAVKDAGEDAKSQVKDNIRNKIKLPRIKF